MEPDAAALAEVYRQLGSISAVLGGFAFASAGALLAASEERRGTAASVAVGAAILSAACFILSSLSWTLAAIRATGVSMMGESLPQVILSLHAAMSLVFEIGILALMASLGASGWVRSRRLGWFTTGVAAAASLAAVAVVLNFVG